MTKKIVKVTAMKRKPVGTVVIDTVENDDWMKSLPGYKNEIALHEQLAGRGTVSKAVGSVV